MELTGLRPNLPLSLVIFFLYQLTGYAPLSLQVMASSFAAYTLKLTGYPLRLAAYSLKLTAYALVNMWQRHLRLALLLKYITHSGYYR